MPSNSEIEATISAVVEAAWNEGCPVAGNPAEAARCARRRLGSLHRRGVDSDDRDAVIEDLSRGLLERLEKEPGLAGPLTVDYRYLAQCIVDAVGDSKPSGD